MSCDPINSWVGAQTINQQIVTMTTVTDKQSEGTTQEGTPLGTALEPLDPSEDHSSLPACLSVTLFFAGGWRSQSRLF